MQQIVRQLAAEIKVSEQQVRAAAELLDGGATVPFIARYRKEVTGGLDDIQLRELEARLSYLRELEDRRVAVLKSIDEQLKSMNLTMGDVVKMQVFLVADPAKGNKMDFAGFMRGYTQYFGTEAQPNLPSRSAFQIAALANPAWYVEIEVVAVRQPKADK